MSLLFRSPFSHFILHNGQEGGHVDIPSISVQYHQELVGVKSLRLHTLVEAIVEGGRKPPCGSRKPEGGAVVGNRRRVCSILSFKQS